MNSSLPRPVDRMIQVFGVRTRSGSTYLHHLIAQHPDCVRSLFKEDFFLFEAHQLRNFVRARDKGNWTRAEACGSLTAVLGSAFVRYAVGGQENKRAVLKTPSPRGIEFFSEFYPHGSFVVIARDGRDCVASAVKAWGFSLETECETFRRNVEYFTAYRDQRFRRPIPFVRYEDLVRDRKRVLTDLFDVLELPAATYPFETDIPLIGSTEDCVNKVPAQERVREKPADFKLESRWLDWTAAERQIFERIAGPSQIALGYDLDWSASHAA